MIKQEFQSPLLSADFAPRVVRRVRASRRRRRILGAAAICASAAIVLWSLRAVYRPPAAPELAQTAAPSDTYRSADYASAQTNPLLFFFPATPSIEQLEAAQPAAWHSYDPWWNAAP